MSENVVTMRGRLTDCLALILTEDYYLKLFTNDVSPDLDYGPGDLTEATGGGYGHKAIDGGDWTAEYANTPPDLILAECEFDFSGPLSGNATVYGWHLIKQDLSVVRHAKRLDASFTPASGGGTLKFTVRIQAGNGRPT